MVSINTNGDDCQPLCLLGGDESLEFAAFYKQFAWAQRVVITGGVLYLPGGYRGICEVGFIVMNSDKGATQAHVPSGDGFHFGAKQLQTRLDFFEKFVI